jgi:hypothetical protein
LLKLILGQKMVLWCSVFKGLEIMGFPRGWSLVLVLLIICFVHVHMIGGQFPALQFRLHQRFVPRTFSNSLVAWHFDSTLVKSLFGSLNFLIIAGLRHSSSTTSSLSIIGPFSAPISASTTVGFDGGQWFDGTLAAFLWGSLKTGSWFFFRPKKEWYNERQLKCHKLEN